MSKAHLSGYNTNADAATIGATGARIFALIGGSILVVSERQKLSDNREGSFMRLSNIINTTVIACTLTGVLGCAILRHKVDLGGIDLAHSASAGALGGTIFAFVVFFFGQFILTWILVVLSFLSNACKMGYDWIFVRSYKVWEKRRE